MTRLSETGGQIRSCALHCSTYCANLLQNITIYKKRFWLAVSRWEKMSIVKGWQVTYKQMRRWELISNWPDIQINETQLFHAIITEALSHKHNTLARLLPRDATHKRGLCCHPVSVRPSVMFRSCAKTNKDIFEIFSPSGSDTILVFPYQTGCRYSDGSPSNWGVECKGVW